MLIHDYLCALKKRLHITMPNSIANMNANAFICPDPRATIAGPGQMPAIPHPMPNMKLPTTYGLLISLPLGICMALPKNALLLLFAM